MGVNLEEKTLANINILLNIRNDAVKFVYDYGSLILEAKRKAIEGKVFKVLTLKQMLQRLPIALAQVKADNTSENLRNLPLLRKRKY